MKLTLPRETDMNDTYQLKKGFVFWSQSIPPIILYKSPCITSCVTVELAEFSLIEKVYVSRFTGIVFLLDSLMTLAPEKCVKI